MANSIVSGKSSPAEVDLTSPQTLTTKTINTSNIGSSTVTTSSIQSPTRLDAKKDTTANLTSYATTASEGQIVYDTDQKKLFAIIDNLMRSIDGSIGEVRHSMLTVAQFQAQMGTGWVLMDGQTVTGSRYHTITGNTTVPDARGRILRAKNNGITASSGNTAGELALGTYQADAMFGHNHQYFAGNTGGGSFNMSPYNGSISQSQALAGLGNPNQVGNPINDGTNGVPVTANETRVKSITVNVFVKIN